MKEIKDGLSTVISSINTKQSLNVNISPRTAFHKAVINGITDSKDDNNDTHELLLDIYSINKEKLDAFKNADKSNLTSDSLLPIQSNDNILEASGINTLIGIKQISEESLKQQGITNDLFKEFFRDNAVETDKTLALPDDYNVKESDKDEDKSKEKKDSKFGDYGLVGQGLDLGALVLAPLLTPILTGFKKLGVKASGSILSSFKGFPGGLKSVLTNPLTLQLGVIAAAVGVTAYAVNELSDMYSGQNKAANDYKNSLSGMIDDNLLNKIEKNRIGPTAELKSYSDLDAYVKMSSNIEGMSLENIKKSGFDTKLDELKSTLMEDAELTADELSKSIAHYKEYIGKEANIKDSSLESKRAVKDKLDFESTFVDKKQLSDDLNNKKLEVNSDIYQSTIDNIDFTKAIDSIDAISNRAKLYEQSELSKSLSDENKYKSNLGTSKVDNKKFIPEKLDLSGLDNKQVVTSIINTNALLKTLIKSVDNSNKEFNINNINNNTSSNHFSMPVEKESRFK